MPASSKPSKPPADAPRVNEWLLGWFRWYARRYLRKSFHTVCVNASDPPRVPARGPLVVYLNHASWWDPLVAMHLADEATPGRPMFAPFDAEALQRYPTFEKLGFFGVDQDSRRGAAQFLKTARAIFADGRGAVWMTPEGRFVDPRETGAGFRPGLSHLVEHLANQSPEDRSNAGDDAASLGEAYALPLAIEYAFWEERLPEALCWWGEPICLADHPGLDKHAWDTLLRERLRGTQATLAERSIARDADAFRVLMGGDEGVGGPYESIRWLGAKLTGRTYRASHSDKLTTS